MTFSKEGHLYVTDCSVHLSTGMTAQSTARADEIYASFEGAVERMEKQLRRYKRRLKDHHRDRQDPIEAIGAPSYILAGGGDDAEAEEPASLQPVIVAEMETQVQFLSVGEAVMQMELAGRRTACLPQRRAWRGERRAPARGRQHRLDRPAEYPVEPERRGVPVSWSYRRSSAPKPCARR